MSAPVLVTIIDQDTKNVILTVDVSLNENHEGDAEATDHPVEQGANITDHIRPKPQMLTIEGFVSNTPLNLSNAPYLQDQPGPAEKAFLDLEARRIAGKLHQVVTKLHTYDNMALLSRPVVRNATIGDALSFKASFKEIRIVQNQVISVPTATPNGQTTKALSKKAANNVSDAAKASNKTVAAGLFDAARSGLGF